MFPVLLLIITISATTATENTTADAQFMNCTAGGFTEGQPASITCHFSQDVSTERYHYYIEKFPFDSDEGAFGEDVLVCFVASSKKLKCDVMEGYSFDMHISDTLTLQIPRVTRGMAGRYTCQHVPPDGRIRNACELRVTVSRNKPVDHQQTSGSKTFHSYHDYDSDHQSSQKSFNTLLIVVSVFLFILVLTVTVLGILLWRFWKKRRDCKRKRNANEPESQPTREESVPLNTIESEEPWMSDLPSPVKRVLRDAYLGQENVFCKVSEEDIDSLRLPLGQRILVKEKLTQLRQEKLNSEKRRKSEEGLLKAVQESEESTKQKE